MNRFSKTLLALTIGVSVSACASGSTAPAGQDEPVKSRQPVDVSDLEGVDAAVGTDIVSYLTDGALNNETILMDEEGTVLTADELSFELAYQAYDAFSFYSYYYGKEPAITDDMGDGTTFGQYIAKIAAETALNYAAAEVIADKEGLKMPAEYQAEVDNVYDNNVRYYGENEWNHAVSAGTLSEADYTEEQKQEWIKEHGTTAFRDYLLYFGTTREAYESLVKKNYTYLTAQKLLFADGGKYALTDEVRAEETAKYVEDNGVVWARCILFSTMEDTEDSAVQAEAQKTYEELSALTGQELSDKFTEMQQKYDKSGYTAGEVQMYTNTDSLVDGYYEGITVLKPGEIGITDRTAYGYFILLREADQPEDLEQTITDSYASNKMKELTAQILEESGGTSESILEKIDTASYYTKLFELQDQINAAKGTAEGQN
ncbi:MAG: hypothetical protein Q4D24_03290 [Erysipelotrichaceae bacterium]|nr:hypothetical protein [Erysipelotrichaceae bacterium]